MIENGVVVALMQQPGGARWMDSLSGVIVLLLLVSVAVTMCSFLRLLTIYRVL